MTRENDSTARTLREKIEHLKAAIAKDEGIVSRETRYFSPFIAGSSGYSRTMSKRLDAEIDRRVDAAVRSQNAKKELVMLESRLALYIAGEVHANGQPRKDAPSRQSYKTFAAMRAAFIKTFAKKGGQMAVFGDEERLLTIQRVNPKSITTTQGANWTYEELYPVTDEGVAMTSQQFGEAFKAWKAQQEGGES